ncbi:hypothetical protein C8R45DRAFT_926972 [Mycena sanguinolenta]|nr:hypothetical protein C8R45DRAFT_926972 [Mycena sanguinolenta]
MPMGIGGNNILHYQMVNQLKPSGFRGWAENPADFGGPYKQEFGQVRGRTNKIRRKFSKDEGQPELASVDQYGPTPPKEHYTPVRKLDSREASRRFLSAVLNTKSPEKPLIDFILSFTWLASNTVFIEPTPEKLLCSEKPLHGHNMPWWARPAWPREKKRGGHAHDMLGRACPVYPEQKDKAGAPTTCSGGRARYAQNKRIRWARPRHAGVGVPSMPQHCRHVPGRGGRARAMLWWKDRDVIACKYLSEEISLDVPLSEMR